jgi:hypothetical protein
VRRRIDAQEEARRPPETFGDAGAFLDFAHRLGADAADSGPDRRFEFGGRLGRPGKAHRRRVVAGQLRLDEFAARRDVDAIGDRLQRSQQAEVGVRLDRKVDLCQAIQRCAHRPDASGDDLGVEEKERGAVDPGQGLPVGGGRFEPVYGRREGAWFHEGCSSVQVMPATQIS